MPADQRNRFADQVSYRTAASDLFQLLRQLDALRDRHNGEVAAAALALRDEVANSLNAERNFGDQNDVRAARDASSQRDPATIAAHHFDHHHAVMRGRRGVNLVDGVSNGVQRRVEAEREFGGRQIVVDRLGHAHNLHALLKQLMADLLRAVAANGDDRVDAQLVRSWQ